MSNLSCTRFSSNYAELFRDLTLFEPSKTVSDLIRPFVPTAKELTDEFLRLVRKLRGVELRPFLGRYIDVRDRTYARSKQFAIVKIDHEAVVARDADHIRGAILQAAFRMGDDLRCRVWDLRAAPHDPGQACTVWMAPGVNVHQSHDDESNFAFIVHDADAVGVVLRAYYAVTPS
jgi:hypothetical protein